MKEETVKLIVILLGVASTLGIYSILYKENKVFRFFWAVGQYRRKFKKFSKPLYMLVKFSLILSLLAWITSDFWMKFI